MISIYSKRVRKETEIVLMDGDDTQWYYSTPVTVFSYVSVAVLPFIFIFCYIQLVINKPKRLRNGYAVLVHLKMWINILAVFLYELLAPRWNIYCTTMIITRFQHPLTALLIFSLLFCVLSVNSIYLANGRVPAHFEQSKASTIFLYATCLLILTPCVVVFYVITVAITNELSTGNKPLMDVKELPILVPEIFKDTGFYQANCHDVVSPPTSMLVLTTTTIGSPLVRTLVVYLIVITTSFLAINLFRSSKLTLLDKDNNVVERSSPHYSLYLEGYLITNGYLLAQTFCWLYIPLTMPLVTSAEYYNPFIILLLPVVYAAELAVMIYWTEEFDSPLGTARKLINILRHKFGHSPEACDPALSDLELNSITEAGDKSCEQEAEIVSENGNDQTNNLNVAVNGIFASAANIVGFVGERMHNLLLSDVQSTPVQMDEATQTSLIPPTENSKFLQNTNEPAASRDRNISYF